MKGTVAVIGAGPGGIVAARWLLAQGFDPTIFEQGPMLGGQRTRLPGLSGVWPAMHRVDPHIQDAAAFAAITTNELSDREQRDWSVIERQEEQGLMPALYRRKLPTVAKTGIEPNQN